jgi:UDP-glucose 6-dehydrogenase
MQMLNSVININNAQPQEIISILINKVPSYFNKKNILILGAAFKSNTDDIRESATIPVIQELLKMEFNISLYDPVAGKNMQKLFKEKISLEHDLSSSIQANDIVILMTMWDEFIDLPNIINKIKPEIDLIDGRRQIGKDSVKNYYGIGLG